MKKFFTLLLAIAMLTSMCSIALAEDTIKIGGLAPLTGEVAQYGIAVQEGVDLYVKLLNDNGGLFGKQIEMIWVDEKGDVTEAINAYNKLVYQDEVAAIIGDVTSKPTLAVAELAVEDGIPMITASSTSYEVTTDKPNVFRSCFLDPFQGATMAKFSKEDLNAQKVAILYDTTDDYCVGLADGFKAQAEAQEQEIVAFEGASSADVDFKAQLTNIMNAQPDIVFVAFYYGPAALILQQADEIGLNVPVLGADGYDGLEYAVSDISLLKDVYYCTHYDSSSDDEIITAFNADFEAAYGKAPYSAFNATGYDAAMLLFKAIEAAEGLDYEDVVAALKASNVDCVTGNITFDDHNDPIKTATIMTFTDGVKTFCKIQNP